MDWSLVSVGQQGVEYVELAFEHGLSLAHAVLRSVDLPAGDCLALVPSDIGEGIVPDFAHGGLGQSRATVSGLASLVAERLRVDGGAFIAENAMARSSDPVRPDDPAARFSFDEEVYEYALAEQATVSRLASLIQLADAGYSMNAVLSTAHVGGELPERLAPIDSEKLRRVAAGAVLLVARAFDGEGFVLWER